MSASKSDNTVPDFTAFQKGITVLKFGRSGEPKERLIKLSDSNRFLSWRSATLSWRFKFGCLSKIDLHSVVAGDSLRRGQTTVEFVRRAKRFHGEEIARRSMSIIYMQDGKRRSLNFCVANLNVFKYVHSVLKYLIDEADMIRKTLSVERLYFKDKFEEADTDFSGLLSKKEIFAMIPSMNISMSKADIQMHFLEKDVNNSGDLDFGEFCEFMEVLRRRVDLETIWSMAISNEPVRVEKLSLSKSDDPCDAVDDTLPEYRFLEFWNATQKERLDPSEMKRRILCAAKGRVVSDTEVSQASDAQTVTFNIFRNIMSSCSNDAYDEDHRNVMQEMRLPLSDYFIASSHNTYLEGNQLTSSSSVNRYISDLNLGCRCVELDCWDGNDGEPVIYHGHTATGKVKFKDVIEAIKREAFVNSEFPVILSFENHCSIEQQGVMAAMCLEILGDGLVKPPIGAVVVLPSPFELRRKFLIKGKGADLLQSPEKEEEEEEELDNFGVDGVRQKKKGSIRGNQKQKQKDKHDMKVHPALAQITFLIGTKAGFTPRESSETPPNHIRSYVESKTVKNVDDPEKQRLWVNHNKTHLTRTYPSGLRTDSSNYDPTFGWLAGAQIVALNYQTGDINMQLNAGRFRTNRNCGYVMKPMRMLSPKGQEALKVYHSKKKPKWGDVFWGPGCANAYPVKVTIAVISGQSLPKPNGSTRGEIIDPYVQLIVNGDTMDRKTMQTKTVQNNGFNPVWNEVFTIEIQRPEIAMITFRCMDEDVDFDDFIASSSIPLCALRQGFRTIQMYDNFGQSGGAFAYAALFVHVKVEPNQPKKGR